MFIDDRTVQRSLKTQNAYVGEVDGIFGPASTAALSAVVRTMIPGAGVWPPARQRIAYEQLMMKAVGIDVGPTDGIAGARTQVAVEKWQDYLTFQRAPLPDAAVAYQHPVWPREADMEAFYGKPGTNQVKVTTPYPLYLDWDLNTKINGFTCHAKVAGSVIFCMDAVLAHYGLEQVHALGIDQFGGCLNVRKMRNGTRWSTHAYGAGIDWDPDRNPLRTPFARSQMGKPEYAPFLDIWQAAGWISLGRARNFDSMHVQAARL